MQHIVEFDKYCNTCAHKDVNENEEPCSDCMALPVREDSRRPDKYEEGTDVK